jgi:hypothetical protein
MFAVKAWCALHLPAATEGDVLVAMAATRPAPLTSAEAETSASQAVMELVRTNSVLLVVQLREAGKSRREVKTAIAAEISCHAADCRCLGAGRPGQPSRFPLAHLHCMPARLMRGPRAGEPPHSPARSPESRPPAKGPRHWPDWPVAPRVAGTEKMVSGAPVGL